jgi:cyclic-di-AMP phosphodiesterase PgpH
VRVLLERRLVATATPNERLTEAARAGAAAAVPMRMQQLDAGQVVVREGETLTDDHLRTLEAAGLYSPQIDALSRTVLVALGSLLLALLLALPGRFAGRPLATRLSPRQVAFIIGITLALLALQRLAFTLSPSFVFILVVPLLVAVLIDEVTGVLWAVWVTVATAVLCPRRPCSRSSPPRGRLAGGGGRRAPGTQPRRRLARRDPRRPGQRHRAPRHGAPRRRPLAHRGRDGVRDLRRRRHPRGRGGARAAAARRERRRLPDRLPAARALEPEPPALQRLLLEAPGSYQHSQIIANLVEQAVLAIGGNALLARVGALYHDVGKMRRPHFFVENQFSGENPHDHISPHLSYLIITSHVRDGVELLREYRLPRELEPFVMEHHGTTVLAYFYKRALEDAGSISELNFRYSGPRPRSKETAVLLLADAVESASRTLTEPTQGSIRALIDRLFDQRLQDDQLSQSPLNLRDVEVIANTFERMLTAVLHRRISYPSAEEIKGLRRDGRDPRRDRSLPAA